MRDEPTCYYKFLFSHPKGLQLWATEGADGLPDHEHIDNPEGQVRGWAEVRRGETEKGQREVAKVSYQHEDSSLVHDALEALEQELKAAHPEIEEVHDETSGRRFSKTAEVMYHAAPIEARDQIAREGLRVPEKPTWWGSRPGVYLWQSEDNARRTGDCKDIYAVNTEPYDVQDDSAKDIQYAWGPDFKSYRIDTDVAPEHVQMVGTVHDPAGHGGTCPHGVRTSAASNTFYHVAPRSAREDILGDGLQGDGIYAWHHYPSAALHASQVHGTEGYEDGADIWAIDPGGSTWNPDEGFDPGDASYTSEYSIPPNRIRLTPDFPSIKGTTAKTAASQEVRWDEAATNYLATFWMNHPSLRKYCKGKYGFDPDDYWPHGLHDEPEHSEVAEKSKGLNEGTTARTAGAEWQLPFSVDPGAESSLRDHGYRPETTRFEQSETPLSEVPHEGVSRSDEEWFGHPEAPGALNVDAMTKVLQQGKSLPPIIVSEYGDVIDGSHRLLAHHRAGMNAIPVYRAIYTESTTAKTAMAVTPEFWQRFLQSTPYAYHYTKPDRVASIMEQGLIPWDELGYSPFRDDPQYIQEYGDHLIPRSGHVYLTLLDGGAQFGAKLTIDLSQLDPSLIAMDEDNADAVLDTGQAPEMWEDWSEINQGYGYTSLGDWANRPEVSEWIDAPEQLEPMLDERPMASFAYRGTIPPQAIVNVQEPARRTAKPHRPEPEYPWLADTDGNVYLGGPGETHRHIAERHKLPRWRRKHEGVVFKGQVIPAGLRPPQALLEIVQAEWQKQHGSDHEKRKERGDFEHQAMSYDDNTWYHVTTPELAQRILQEGLRPTSETGITQNPYAQTDRSRTYMFSTPERAYEYGRRKIGPNRQVLQVQGIDPMSLTPDPEDMDRLRDEFWEDYNRGPDLVGPRLMSDDERDDIWQRIEPYTFDEEESDSRGTEMPKWPTSMGYDDWREAMLYGMPPEERHELVRELGNRGFAMMHDGPVPPQHITRLASVKTADYQGWSNWDSWSVKLMLDNDYDLYQQMQKMLEQGLSIEQLKQFALENVIGPHNRQAIEDAQEWNDIPEEERLDPHFEDLNERNPQAADFVDALGFGADVSDDEPTLIDESLVNWDEIYQSYMDELQENQEYEQEQQSYQERGMPFAMPGHSEETNTMLNAWLQHHGVMDPEQKLENGRSAEFQTPFWVPFEHIQQGGSQYSWPEGFSQPHLDSIPQEGGFQDRLRDVGWNTLWAVQRGQANPYTDLMHQALEGQGYSPEQIQQTMRQKYRWDPNLNRWENIEQLDQMPRVDPALDQPGDFTLPPNWSKVRDVDRIRTSSFAAKIAAGMADFARALTVVSALQKQGLIRDFAVMGSVAAMARGLEPSETKDLDVVVLVDSDMEWIQLLTKIREQYQTQGWGGASISGVDVEFLPTTIDPIYAAGLAAATPVAFAGQTAVKVLTVEYLIILALKAWRPTDRGRIAELLPLADRATLDGLIQQYDDGRLAERLRYIESAPPSDDDPGPGGFYQAKRDYHERQAKLPFEQKLTVLDDLYRGRTASEFGGGENTPSATATEDGWTTADPSAHSFPDMKDAEDIASPETVPIGYRNDDQHWALVNGRIGFGRTLHAAMQIAAQAAELPKTDVLRLTNMMAAGAYPLNFNYDIAAGILIGKFPRIWASNFDRNAAYDLIVKSLETGEPDIPESVPELEPLFERPKAIRQWAAKHLRCAS